MELQHLDHAVKIWVDFDRILKDGAKMGIVFDQNKDGICSPAATSQTERS
jgi:hypothetical protein